MHRFLKNTLIRVSALGKIFPTRLTPEEDVKALIYSLRPRLADQKLIRLGPSGDGGYLVPDDLEDIEACLSPGVALVSGFERDCAALGMKIFMAGMVQGSGKKLSALQPGARNRVGQVIVTLACRR